MKPEPNLQELAEIDAGIAKLCGLNEFDDIIIIPCVQVEADGWILGVVHDQHAQPKAVYATGFCCAEEDGDEEVQIGHEDQIRKMTGHSSCCLEAVPAYSLSNASTSQDDHSIIPDRDRHSYAILERHRTTQEQL